MEPVLKDLCALIRKSTLHYQENCEQKDVQLTDEFKMKFAGYFRDRDYMVDFYEYTAFITTSAGRYMFVPNQWFVVAAYSVGVYIELMKYKKHLFAVCEYMGEKPKVLIPTLRDNTGSVDRNLFFEACDCIFREYGKEAADTAKMRLWRFATDYAWWSGNKTADRKDFYKSVILNMLSFVAVSGDFIPDIVAGYCEAGMTDMVSDLSDFTLTENGPTFSFDGYQDPANDYRPEPKKIQEVRDTEKIPYDTDSDGDIVISVRRKK